MKILIQEMNRGNIIIFKEEEIEKIGKEIGKLIAEQIPFNLTYAN